MTTQPNQNVEFEDLIVGHFDDTLNEQQEKDLATALATSAKAKQYFLSYMRMEGRLHSFGRDGFLREPATEPAVSPQQIAKLSADVATRVSGGRQRRRLFAASSLAACVAVMLMLLYGVLWPASVSASSVLQRAQAAAAELIDRTYRVALSGSGEGSTTSTLTIHVRGGGRFLVRPDDGGFVMGSSGTDYWATQPNGPVWVTYDSRLLIPKLKQWLPNMWLFGIASSPHEPLLLDMTGVLSLIRRKHDVELIDSANSAEHHVRATLRRDERQAAQNAPERIDFWADAESGLGLRAEVYWADGRQLRFELVKADELADQWYHYSEHAPGREVKRLSKQRSTRSKNDQEVLNPRS